MRIALSRRMTLRSKRVQRTRAPRQTAAGPFGSAGSMLRSKPALMLAGALVVAVFGTQVWKHDEAKAQTKQAEGVAHALLNAAKEWKRNSGAGCPSVSKLIADDLWSRDSRAEDPWGNRYRISCRADTLRVRSAGQDRRFKTADDINVAADWNT